MSQYGCMLIITHHTRSCLDCRVHSPLFTLRTSTCRRHRHGRPVLLVAILILHARVPTYSRSHESDPVNARMRLSLAPIPSQLACAKVRAGTCRGSVQGCGARRPGLSALRRAGSWTPGEDHAARCQRQVGRHTCLENERPTHKEPPVASACVFSPL